jgi:hypothetical protein
VGEIGGEKRPAFLSSKNICNSVPGGLAPAVESVRSSPPPHEQESKSCKAKSPEMVPTVPGGDESNCPTDENRRDAVVKLAGLKIDIREPIH